MTSSLSKDALAALRKSYERAELDETRSADDPLKQFERWLTEAVEALGADENGTIEAEPAPAEPSLLDGLLTPARDPASGDVK